MNIRRQLILDKHMHNVDYGNGHEINEAIISAMEEYAREQLKKRSSQSVDENFNHEIIVNELTIRLTFNKEKQSLNVAAFGEKCNIYIKPNVVNSICLNFR